MSNTSFIVFYRTSVKFGKTPLDGADAAITMRSLYQSFDAKEIVVISDNNQPYHSLYFENNGHMVYRTSMGNSRSFLLQIKLALKFYYADYYYFVEDDHLHLDRQKEFIIEGLKYFDIVSLYDHPDKYTSLYSHLQTRLVATALGHFRDAPSTVMTFAINRKTLEKLGPFFLASPWIKDQSDYPKDNLLFEDLTKMGFKLGTLIPSRSTHCEATGLTPYVDWNAFINFLRNKP